MFLCIERWIFSTLPRCWTGRFFCTWFVLIVIAIINHSWNTVLNTILLSWSFTGHHICIPVIILYEKIKLNKITENSPLLNSTFIHRKMNFWHSASGYGEDYPHLNRLNFERNFFQTYLKNCYSEDHSAQQLVLYW